MKNFLKKIPDNPKALLFTVIGIFALALGIFLFSRDGYGNGPTGAATVFSQGIGYLLVMALFLTIAGGAIWLAIVVYTNDQNGKSLSFKALVIVAIVFIALAVGKGCTDKTNEGVTAPRGRPDPIAQMA